MFHRRWHGPCLRPELARSLLAPASWHGPCLHARRVPPLPMAWTVLRAGAGMDRASGMTLACKQPACQTYAGTDFACGMDLAWCAAGMVFACGMVLAWCAAGTDFACGTFVACTAQLAWTLLGAAQCAQRCPKAAPKHGPCQGHVAPHNAPGRTLQAAQCWVGVTVPACPVRPATPLQRSPSGMRAAAPCIVCAHASIVSWHTHCI